MLNGKKRKIKLATDIVKEILKRGSIKVPENNITGEEFEKWLREVKNCHDNK